MKKQDRLAAHKVALSQQLEQVETEKGWSRKDQNALEQGLKDLDAGNGVDWEVFRKKFARYEH